MKKKKNDEDSNICEINITVGSKLGSEKLMDRYKVAVLAHACRV